MRPSRDALNFQHGWARPDDPERARELHGVPSQARTHEGLTLRAGREGVHAYVTALVAAGQVTDRASLVEALEGAGLSVPRQGKDYLTVADPESGERLRMKGRLYEKGWSYDAELDRASRREAGYAVGRDRAPDHERAEAAWREVEARVRDRAQFHERLFARGARDRDAALEPGLGEAQALGPLVVAALALTWLTMARLTALLLWLWMSPSGWRATWSGTASGTEGIAMYQTFRFEGRSYLLVPEGTMAVTCRRGEETRPCLVLPLGEAPPVRPQARTDGS